MANNRELSQFANVVGYNGGSIGIGTDNPDATLKVNVASGNNGVVVQNTSTANIALIGARNGDATLQVGQFGSTASGTTFGLSNANLAFIYTTTYNTTHPSALALGAVSNKPIVFATNNTERLRITSDGDVGINIANPDRKLEVVDTAGSLTFPVAVSNHTDASAGVGAGIAFHLTSGGNARGDFGVVYAGNDNSDGTDFVFRPNNGSTGSEERLRIEGASGYIGIGTDNARRLLHLCGGNETTKIQITNATTGSVNDGDGFQLSIATDGTAGIEQRENLDLFIATNNTERVRFTNNGKFLKGISSSRNIYGIHSNFQIEGTDFQSSSLSITCNSTSETPILLLGRSRGTSLGSNTALTDGQTIGEISFVPSDGTDMGSASVRLQGVADDNHGSNDVPGRFIIQVVADGSESSSERFRLGHDGRMRVTGVYQETTGGSANVNVQSDGLMQRSVSSIKYKKDVETLEDSYADALLNLRPVWYRSKCASDNPNHGHWGFVAEELAEIDPRLVIWKNTEISWDENGFAVETSCDPEPEGVQYDRFVPHLLNLIKRQKDTITSQQAQINDLLSRVAALEGS